jgi:phosphate transport system substrate-binding protein
MLKRLLHPQFRKPSMRKIAMFVILPGVFFVLMLSCGQKNHSGSEDTLAAKLTGRVSVDGSSTVYTITEAVAEEFGHVYKNVKVTIAESGTGGGFQKFGRGETDINDASREIQPTEERFCKANNITFQKLLVAHDGLVIVVNPQNTWCKNITVAELKKIWEPSAQNRIKRWNQIRKEWPDREIHLFGAGSQSGTFDFFTEMVCGEAKSSRGDYTASEDDNILVQGIKGDKYALGYFGHAYYEASKEDLRLVGVDNGKGPVIPTPEAIKNKTYEPLSRPLFIYVSGKSVQREEVRTFVNYYLDNTVFLSKEVGYVSLTPEEVAGEKEKFTAFIASINKAK